MTLKNSVEVSQKMFQRCVISDVMMDMFASLDHSRVDPQLQIKYLLKLVRVKMKVCGKILESPYRYWHERNK